MSEFTSEFQLFTSVTDGASWSSPNNVLDGSDFTLSSTWFGPATMAVNLPTLSIPGGIPVTDAVTINDLQLQIRWQRAGNENSGGRVDLENFNIGGGPISEDFSSTVAIEPLHTDQLGGDPAYWNVTQQQMKDFINGTTDLDFNRNNVSINGSAQVKIAWIKVQIQYTYTGGGVAMPIRF